MLHCIVTTKKTYLYLKTLSLHLLLLSALFFSQRHEGEKPLSGGRHSETRNHVWSDELLGEARHEVRGVRNGQRRRLHLHQQVCQEHVLSGLHQGQRSGAGDHGNPGAGA